VKNWARHMTVPKEIAAEIENGHALLDTNIFIGTYESPSAFKPLYDLLTEQNCAPTHFSFIEFEFLRSVKKDRNRTARKALLQKIQPTELPVQSSELYGDALRIASYYSENNHQGAELADCYIAALMKKYHRNLFLITMNHRDFPPILFEPLAILTLEAGTKWYHPGIYRYRDGMIK